MATDKLSKVTINHLFEKKFFDEHGHDRSRSSSAQPAGPVQIVEELEKANERMSGICYWAR